MNGWLRISKGIDGLTEFVGRQVGWLVLIAVLVSAGNAVVRKAFNISSNALLEVQWYFFAGSFLLAAGYTLLRQEHVKIDVVLGRFKRRTQVAVEIFGLLAFLLPFSAVVIVLAWPLLASAHQSGEVSSNAGGLLRWPVYALVPAGFALLTLQAASELIKRVAFLRRLAPDPAIKPAGKTAEEDLAELIRARAEGVRA